MIFHCTITRRIRVDATYVPGSRGPRDFIGGRRCGPPLEPDEDPYWEIDGVTDLAGLEVGLNDDEMEAVAEQIAKQMHNCNEG